MNFISFLSIYWLSNRTKFHGIPRRTAQIRVQSNSNGKWRFSWFKLDAELYQYERSQNRGCFVNVTPFAHWWKCSSKELFTARQSAIHPCYCRNVVDQDHKLLWNFLQESCNANEPPVENAFQVESNGVMSLRLTSR